MASGTYPRSCLMCPRISGTCWECPALARVNTICMKSLSIRLTSPFSMASRSSLIWSMSPLSA
uniref:Uncharacterized protein n=1 Tax=Anguilla anguilla TaxID=7936 RepID=A0A0E9TQG6_ANGAN